MIFMRLILSVPAEAVYPTTMYGKQTDVAFLPSVVLQMDPLGKAMTAFAAALDVPVNRLQFTFDGDPISPKQTPNDLEMDHDDIVDARLLS